MRAASLIGHARELLQLVVDGTSPADLLYDRYVRERRYLGARDRRALSDLFYSSLRRIHTAQAIREGAPSDRSILSSDIPSLLGIILLRRDEIDPVDVRDGLKLTDEEIVGLREAIDRFPARLEELSDVGRLAARTGYPLWLTRLVAADHGDEAEPLLTALKSAAETVIRVDTDRFVRSDIARMLESAEIATRPTRFADAGLIVEGRKRLIDLEPFRRGAFEIQDEGSQLLTQFLAPQPEWNVFDACAGGGGKTLHIASMMKGRGMIAAHDADVRRLSGLPKRIERHGYRNITIITPPTFLLRQAEFNESFDAVMIDAPCSGTGTLRRNPGILLRLGVDDLKRLVALQGEILDMYQSLVKPGGVLLYATCSILDEENEVQVGKFLDRWHGWRVDREAGGVESELISPEGYLKTSPHRHGTDGFFGARLIREH